VCVVFPVAGVVHDSLQVLHLDKLDTKMVAVKCWKQRLTDQHRERNVLGRSVFGKGPTQEKALLMEGKEHEVTRFLVLVRTPEVSYALHLETALGLEHVRVRRIHHTTDVDHAIALGGLQKQLHFGATWEADDPVGVTHGFFFVLVRRERSVDGSEQERRYVIHVKRSLHVELVLVPPV